MNASSYPQRFVLVTALFLTALLAACGGGGGGGGSGGGGGGGETTETLPLAVLTYPAPMTCGAQLNNAPLKFIFTRAMDATSVDLTGAPPFDSESMTPIWSTSTLTDDTLTLTPMSTWSTGANLLKFLVYEADSGDPLLVWYTPTIFSGSMPTLVYVSADTGNDAHSGLSVGNAVKTVNQGMAVAGAGPAVVQVAAATAAGSAIAGTKNLADAGNPYRGYDAGAATNNMIEGISFCGGFTTDFATRDPAAHETVYASTAITGGASAGALVAPLTADNTISAATVLEGFTIVAPGPDTVTAYTDSNHWTGALVVQGALQVRRNKLVSGGADHTIIASVNTNPAPNPQALFSNNRLQGSGTSIQPSYGLYVAEAVPVFDSGYIGISQSASIYVDNVSTSGTVTIANSDLDGGAAPGLNSIGIQIFRGDANIANNVEINGGGVAGSGFSTAILFQSASSGTVTNNLIDGGIAQQSTGVWITSSGTISLTDNNIFGGDPDGTGTGVNDSGANTTLEHNSINGSSAATQAIAIHAASTGVHKYLRNVIIRGLSGTANTGILLDSATTGVVVEGNQMTGCTDYTGFSGQQACIAIDNSGSSNVFRNNTINGGLGVGVPKSAVFLQRAAASLTTLTDNIFFTAAGGTLNAAGGRCIDLTHNTSADSFSSVGRNDFFSCGGSLFWDGTTEFTISQGISYITGGPALNAVGNIQDVNPGFVKIGTNPARLGSSEVDWHLTAGSDASVREGGSYCTGIHDYDDTAFGLEDGNKAAMGAFVSPTQMDGKQLPLRFLIWAERNLRRYASTLNAVATAAK